MFRTALAYQMGDSFYSFYQTSVSEVSSNMDFLFKNFSELLNHIKYQVYFKYLNIYLYVVML